IEFEDVSWSIYEPDAGYLVARRGCEAVFNAFLKEGGEYRQAEATPGPIAANRMEGISLAPREILNADSYVFACGPWLGKVFPFLRPIITPTRQEVFFFGTAAGDLRFTEAQLPVWIDNSKLPVEGLLGKHWFYVIPGNHWRGFNVADGTRRAAIEPTTMGREISAERCA